MNRSILSLLIAFTLMNSACSPKYRGPEIDRADLIREQNHQESTAFRQYYEQLKRFSTISYSLLRATADLEKASTVLSRGFTYQDSNTYPKFYRAIANEQLKLRNRVRVQFVYPNSPADKAGLKEGDLIVAVEGKELGKKSTRSTLKRLLEQAHVKNKEVISMTVLRNESEILTCSLGSELIANYTTELILSSKVNAYASGSKISVTSSMINFVENDSELALVIGHEIAHNYLGHISQKVGRYFLGSVLDVAAATQGANTQGAFGKIAAGAFSKSNETEADYVGLYIAKRAGYNVKKASILWRRMGIQHPGSTRSSYTSTHPSTPQRYIAIDKAIDEIHQKEIAGINLLPELSNKR